MPIFAKYQSVTFRIISMKTLAFLSFLLITFSSLAQEELIETMYNQTADEIITKYIDRTGGIEAWSEIDAIKTKGSFTQGDLSVPITIYNTRSGKQAVVFEYNKKKVTQMAFDGATMWTTNFLTMEPEISSDDMRKNMLLKRNDFPSPLLHYRENGYKAEYISTVAKNGIVAFKIKLTQEPRFVNGEEVPNESFYFFDAQNYYPIAIETTQLGQSVSITMSDYQEVEGLYFPFTISQGGQPIDVKEIILNPEIDYSIFSFPEN